jgi:hypothetical protein
MLDAHTTSALVLFVSGQLATEDLEVVRNALSERRILALELAEVELASRDVVKLLARAEAEGIELRNCPAYIREWITSVRKAGKHAE